MYSKVKNLVEYIGLADELPMLDNPASFKQFCLHETTCLPESKPSILQLVKVVSDIAILDTRVVRTPKAVSLEGQKLTGFKLMLEGLLKQKIEYVGDTPAQEVHAVHCNIPFSTFIILPENFKPNTAVKAAGYLEDISSCVFEKRIIIQNAILLAVADLY